VSARRRDGPRRSEWRWGPLYALPAIVVVVAFIGYPFASIVYHAFTSWDGFSSPEWIGLRNFQFLLRDPYFQTALRNNIIFALSVPIQLVIPLVLAYLIHERLPGWRFYRWTYFLPAVLSTVVVGILARIAFQFDGPINGLIRAGGLDGLAANWLQTPATSLPVILLVVVWANFGYNVVLYLSGMSGIEPSLPEAARIDGAGSYQVLRHVYVPGLRRVMEIVLVINTIAAFAYMFTYVYTITNGGPGFETYVSELLIYNNAFAFQRLGYASAMGLTLTALIAVVGLFQIRVLTRGSEE
jgi:ABC-type sugar transport system permease subunit